MQPRRESHCLTVVDSGVLGVRRGSQWGVAVRPMLPET